MNLLPLGQKKCRILNDGAPDCRNLSVRKAVVFAESYFFRQCIQLKNGMMPPANNVNVRGPVIVRINHNPQCANP